MEPALILRLGVAYGAAQAVAASAVIIVAGVVLGQMTVGVTRQPLPLIWPLGVLLVLAAHLPLREILGRPERVSTRAVPTRALRAALSVVIVAIALTVDAVTHVDASLAVFLLLLLAAGFAVVPLTGAEPWAVTLGLGMAWVGLQFITPLGLRMVLLLERIGVGPAAGLALAAGTLFVVTDLPLLSRRH